MTGASSGIGEAIAKDLVKEGLQVIGIARRKDRLESLAASLKDSKGKFHPFVGDVSKESDVLDAFKFAKTIGPVHILVNNAGIFRINSLTDGDTEKWRQVFDVNVLGLCVATREAVRDMKNNSVDGHIVHINSIGGHKVIGGESMNVYCASKFAVTALTETLRLELNSLGSKIKVSSVSPGFVKTEIGEAAGWPKVQYEQAIKTSPHLESQDISDAVLYVLGTPPHVQVHELIIKPVGEKPRTPLPTRNSTLPKKTSTSSST